VNPRDFLDTAKGLLEKDNPPNCRSVFNRSYYAAYNVGVNLLEDAGITIKKNATGHGEVNKYLGNCGIREIKEAQSRLSILASQRIRADYRLSEKPVEKLENAKKALLTSERIIDTFALFDSNDGKEKIFRGVNAYNEIIKSAGKHTTPK
jgi:hypothetical protein